MGIVIVKKNLESDQAIKQTNTLLFNVIVGVSRCITAVYYKDYKPIIEDERHNIVDGDGFHFPVRVRKRRDYKNPNFRVNSFVQAHIIN